MDCSPPGTSVHRISWERILEWVAILFSWGSSNPGIKPQSPTIADRFLTPEPKGVSLIIREIPIETSVNHHCAITRVATGWIHITSIGEDMEPPMRVRRRQLLWKTFWEHLQRLNRVTLGPRNGTAELFSFIPSLTSIGWGFFSHQPFLSNSWPLGRRTTIGFIPDPS